VNAIAVAAVVLACVFGGAVIGLLLRTVLPSHHLTAETKDIVKLGIGVVATMASLVLGLLVSSAKDSFDKTSDELTQVAARVIQLDHALARYGTDAKEIRARLRQDFQTVADALLSPDKSSLAPLRSPGTDTRVHTFQAGIRALAPGNDDQREMRSQALALAEEVNANRTILLLRQHDSISVPLLVVVVSWFTLIFVGFGLFCPRNRTAIVALFLCALSVAGAMFLILEMDDPLAGMVRISDVPMRTALAILAKG
jgi:hypothetical protein